MNSKCPLGRTLPVHAMVMLLGIATVAESCINFSAEGGYYIENTLAHGLWSAAIWDNGQKVCWDTGDFTRDYELNYYKLTCVNQIAAFFQASFYPTETATAAVYYSNHAPGGSGSTLFYAPWSTGSGKFQACTKGCAVKDHPQCFVFTGHN